MPNEIFEFFKANNLTDKDEKTFLSEYSDSAKAREIWLFMRENDLTDKDEKLFFDTYLKKSPNQTVSSFTTPVSKSGGVPTSPLIFTSASESPEGKPKTFGEIGGAPPPPKKPTVEDVQKITAGFWAKKPESQKILQAPKTGKPVDEREYAADYTEARLTFEKLPSYVKGRIADYNKGAVLDYLKDNPNDAQKLYKWYTSPEKAGLQEEQIAKEIVTKAVSASIQPELQELEAMNKQYGTDTKILRLNALVTDLDKAQDDLKKYQTQVEFLQNQYTQSKGNKALVDEIKATKNELNKFNVKEFTNTVNSLQQELLPLQQQLAQFEQYAQTGIPQELYPQYQQIVAQYNALAGEQAKLVESPEYKKYLQDTERYNQLVGQQKELVSELEGLPEYKSALDNYNKSFQRYEGLMRDYESIDKNEINKYIDLSRKVGKAQETLDLIAPAFPIALEREQLQRKMNEFRKLNPQAAMTLKTATAWETIPEAVEKAAAGVFSTLSAFNKLTTGTPSESYTLLDKMSDYLNDFGKINNTVNYEAELVKDGNINFKEIPVESLRQVGNLAVFATIGRFTGAAGVEGMLGYKAAQTAPMVGTAYFMSRKDRENEADRAGLTGAQKEMYVSTLSFVEGLSELIMPDSQLLTKEVRNKLLKDAVKGVSKGKNWYTKQALLTIAENSSKEAAEELTVKLAELMQKTAVNYSNGNVFNTDEYKNWKEWAATALVAAPLAGVSTSISKIGQPTKEMNADLYKASSELTASRAVLDNMIEKGKLTTEQADEVYKKIVRFAAVRDVIPQDISPEKAAELAPIIEENETIKLMLTEANEIFKPRLQQALKANVEKAQQILLRPETKKETQDEPITRTDEGRVTTTEEPIRAAATTGEEGVQETNVPIGEEISVEPNTPYSFEYKSESEIPSQLRGVKPINRSETQIGASRFGKKEKKIRLTFSGQQLIDAGLAKDINAQQPITPQNDIKAKKADIERRRQEELNTQTTAGYGVIASDYLFTGGRGSMLSTDYLLQALTSSFEYAGKQIDAIRNKYAAELGNIKDDVGTEVYNKMMQEIKDVINNTYKNKKAEELFDKILDNATGFVSREGNQVSSELDTLNESHKNKINAKYDAEIDALNNQSKILKPDDTKTTKREVPSSLREGETAIETQPIQETSGGTAESDEREASAKLRTEKEEVKPELTPSEKTNLESVGEQVGKNFREVQNVYVKYGEGKPLSEITAEDYRKAQEKRDASKEQLLNEQVVDEVAEKVIQARDAKRGYDKKGGRKKAFETQATLNEKAQKAMDGVDTKAPEYETVKAIEENIDDIMNDLMNNGLIEDTDCVL